MRYWNWRHAESRTRTRAGRRFCPISISPPPGTTTIRERRGWTEITFPLQLGNLPQAGDGLAGYFVVEEKPSDFATFYATGVQTRARGAEAPAKVVSAIENPLPATFSSGPTTVALLHDPAFGVHATSGILPAAKIAVPQDLYAAALGRLEVYFYAGPVLLHDFTVDLQLPNLPGFQWSWCRKGPAGWTSEPWKAAADQHAVSGYKPPYLQEGWVILKKSSAKP